MHKHKSISHQQIYKFVDIMTLVGILLFPISLFANFPQSIGTLFSTLVLFLCFLIIIYRHPETRKQKFDIICDILVSFLSLYLAVFSPYWNSEILSLISEKSAPQTENINYKLNKKDTFEDLEYMFKHVKKIHPLMIDKDYEPFLSKYNAILANTEKSDSISIVNLWQNCQQVLSSLHDGHTKIYPQYNQWHRCNFDSLGTIVSINGESVSDIFDQKKTLYSTETEQWAKNCFLSHLHTYEGLSFLGFELKNGLDLGIENDYGDILYRKVFESDFSNQNGHCEYMQNKGIGYWRINDTCNYCYLRLNNCNYYGIKRRRFFDKSISMMFDSIQRDSISNLIIDVRDNKGGNPAICMPLLKYLPNDINKMGRARSRRGPFLISYLNVFKKKKYLSNTFYGNVYCLTSSSTFSAAMMLADRLQGNNLAKILGETPGNTPNCYSNITRFTLPHSKLSLDISTTQYFRVNESIEYDILLPDIEVKSEYALQSAISCIQ